MTRPFLLVVPMALLLGACATTQANQPQSAASMVDAATGTLDPRYNDGTFSLAEVYAARTQAPLSRSDRRLVDETTRAVFAEPADATPGSWDNPVTEHSGAIDLTAWTVDQRQNELCGTIEHAARLGSRVEGVVVICRGPEETRWSVDEARFEEPRRATRRSAPAARTLPARPFEPPAEPARPRAEPERSVSGGNPNVRPPNYTPPACPDVPGGGAQTLGDCVAAPTS
ncbi:MAG: hypothetical protein ACFBWO_18865 [Paracoccaceae bacterium]